MIYVGLWSNVYFPQDSCDTMLTFQLKFIFITDIKFIIVKVACCIEFIQVLKTYFGYIHLTSVDLNCVCCKANWRYFLQSTCLLTQSLVAFYYVHEMQAVL